MQNTDPKDLAPAEETAVGPGNETDAAGGGEETGTSEDNGEGDE